MTAPRTSLPRRRRKACFPSTWPFMLQLVLIACTLQSLWVSTHLHSRTVVQSADDQPPPPQQQQQQRTDASSSINATEPIELLAPTLPNQLLSIFNETNSSQSLNRLKLRFDWTALEPLSPLAVRMQQHQSNCSLPVGYFRYRNRFGLGSDLHVYSQAICNAMQAGVRVQTARPWNWWNAQACDDDDADPKTSASAMTCYFPSAEEQCPGDVQHAVSNNYAFNISNARGKVKQQCASLVSSEFTIPEWRAATTEFLFSPVSPHIQQEAYRQLHRVFDAHNEIPKDLIAVHIRWGDKEQEIKLLSIESYIQAVRDILQRRGGKNAVDGPANIFLATEDPRAVYEFKDAAPLSWKVYVDQYHRDLEPFRRDVYNGPNHMALDLQGAPGTIALGSILVAMEAVDYVLTTASNWSRLMNELRKNVVDPRCGNCTSMIDLKSGEW